MTRPFALIAVLLAALLSTPAAHAADADVHGFIVQLKEAPAADGAAKRDPGARWHKLVQDHGLAAEAPRLQPHGRSAQVLRFARPLDAAAAERLAERLRRDPAVDWVVPNTREKLLQVPPNDPLYPGLQQQWWLQSDAGTSSNALEGRLRGVPDVLGAWLRLDNQPRYFVPVAVLDSGITAHPELAGQVLPGYDFVTAPERAADGDGRDPDPTDPGDAVTAADRASSTFSNCSESGNSWHGTAIAGQIAALTNNLEGVASINTGARIVPVRVAGKCGAELADILDALRWAAGIGTQCRRDDGRGNCLEVVPPNQNPVRIVNISFGGTSACTAAYQQVIDELKARGVVVVAAAGNDAGAPARPASCRDTVGVTALNRDGFKAGYSSFGPAIDIATVGGDDASGNWGALSDGGLLTLHNNPAGAPTYSRLFGTSFAAPVVTGTLSLMLGANPALTHEQLVDGLRRTARPHVTSSFIGACSAANPGRCICTTGTCGAGILDAEQAALYALHPADYVAPAQAAVSIDSPEIEAVALLGLDRPVGAAAESSGGGAMGGTWLALLALAAGALRFNGRRRA